MNQRLVIRLSDTACVILLILLLVCGSSYSSSSDLSIFTLFVLMELLPVTYFLMSSVLFPGLLLSMFL